MESLFTSFLPENLFTPEKPLTPFFVKLREILASSSTVIEPTFFSLRVTSCHDVSLKLLTLSVFFLQGKAFEIKQLKIKIVKIPTKFLFVELKIKLTKIKIYNIIN